MKYIFILLIILGFSFFMIDNVYATSGCCSSHDGVNCNVIQSNGKVICNDGWTGSSCSYSSMVKCEGYNPSVSGSVKKSPSYVYGCTDKNAKNYNYKANKDNGSCIYYVLGCTDKDAINYNARAEKDDGSCEKAIYGCMDNEASNYNANANKSDDSCEYKNEVTSGEYSDEAKNDDDKTIENSSTDSDDFGIGIAGLGILGATGYFIVKKFKKYK